MDKINTEQERSKYAKILCNMHKNIPTYIPFILIIKSNFTENFTYFFFAYLFRFFGILIKCSDFSLSDVELKKSKSLSRVLRNFTSYSLVKKFGFTNKSYIICSFIIFILFLIRLSCYIIEYYSIKCKENKENFEPFKFKIFMDHIVFLFFPFITEFLFLIYFMILYPDKFIIKKNNSYKIFNYIMLLINGLLIIIYYLNVYIFMLCVNKPLNDSHTPIKYRYSSFKFIIIFILQIFTLIECIPIYLGNNSLKWYQILTYFFLFIVLISLSFLSIKCYNYLNIINYMLKFVAFFSFISMFTEVLLHFFNFACETYEMLFCITLIKVILIFGITYVSINLTKKYLRSTAKTELFKTHKYIHNQEIIDTFLYINHLLKEIINNGNCMNDLMEIIILHKKNCKFQNCKCKLIQTLPYGKNSDNKVFLENLINRVSFFIESSFAQMDYANNYTLVLLLCEHYHHVKNNSIMSYSMVQTLLNFQFSKLSIKQLIFLYEVSQKYVNSSIYYYIKKSDDPKYKNHIQTQKLFQETFYNLNKIKKIKKIMIKYSNNILTIVKYKEQFEESIKIIKDEESGELKNLLNTFMITRNFNKIIEKIKIEDKNYDNLINNIKYMNHKKNPIEFYYKSFLFFDFFFGGEIKEELINKLYSWTKDRSLYSSKINPNIFILLYRRYMDANFKTNTSYSVIFKYSSGLKIVYISDSLANKLSYNQNDLTNKNIDILLPSYLNNAHNLTILKYLIAQQTMVFGGINNFMFDKNNLMFKSFLNGASLPGVKKNLLILCNIKISDEKKQMFFILDKKFDLVSMSYNLTTDYNLTNDLIQEFDIDFLKLFSIQKHILLNKFQKKIDEINIIKKNNDLILDYHFIGKLFKNPEKNSNKNNYRKQSNFKILDDLDTYFKDEEMKLNSKEDSIQNAKNIIENIYNKNNIDQFKTAKFYLTVPKIQVIYNLENFLFKSKEVDLDNENYRILLNKLEKIKLLDINSEYSISKKNIRKFNKKRNLLVNNDHFNIECRLSLLYDTYYYTFKINEISSAHHFLTKEEILINTNNKLYIDNNLLADEKSPESVENLKNKNKVNKKNLIFDEALIIKEGNNTNNSTKEEIYKKDKKTSKKTLCTESVKSFLYNNHSVNEIISLIEKAKSIDKSICDFYIKYILFFIMISLLIIYVFILLYQNKIITTSHDIFLVLFYDYYQRDKIINILSLINCVYISVMGFTNYVNSTYSTNLNITLFDIGCLLSKYSPQLEDSYYRFFNIYKNYKLKNNKPMSAYLQLKNVTKLTKDWQTKTYSSDILSIFQSISFFTNKLFLTDDEKIIAKYKHDFQFLFHLDFEKKLLEGNNIKMEDDLCRIVYFLMRNYFSNIKVFLSDLQEEAENDFADHSHTSIIIYTILEVLGLLIYFCLFFVILYYLHQNNKSIFGYILNIFLDFTQSENYHFKNHKDNYVSIKKITDISHLISDFSIKNLKKFNLKVEEIKSLSFIENESSAIVSNINSNRKESNNLTKEIIKKGGSPNYSKINDKSSSMSQSNLNLIKNKNNNNYYLQNLNLSRNTNTKNSSTAMMKTNNSSIYKYNMDNNINLKDQQLLHKNKKINQKEDDLINENNLNIEIIKKKLKREGLIKIRNMHIVLFFLFLIVVIYTSIVYFICYNFLTQIKQIFNDFGVITYQYSGMYEYFNALLIYLIMPKFADHNFMENLRSETEKQKKNIQDINKNRFDNFPLTKKFYNELNENAPEGENIHPHILEILCEGKENDYNVIVGKDYETVFNTNGKNCKNVLDSDYSLMGKGIDMERDTITTEIMDIYNDFKKLEKGNNEFNFTIEFLKLKLSNKKFYELDLNINVILNKVQEKLYNYFYEDQENISNNFFSKINIFNFCAIGYCIFFSGVILIYIVLNLVKLNKLIEASSFRITKTLCYIKLRNVKFDSL